MLQFKRDSVYFVIAERLALPAIILVGAFLQFFHIASYSLGFDEAHSVYLAHLKIDKLLLYVSRDTGPPLFYLMLKGWMHFFGDGVRAVRSLSALFMILTIPTTFLLVKELFNKRTAYLAALFVAIGPFIVRYGHEARMYAPMTFFILFSTYLLTITLRKRLAGWLGFTAYTLVMVAAVYTHYYSFLILPSQWILVMVLQGQEITFRNGWKNLKNRGWLASQAAILLAYLPWLPSALKQSARIGVTASTWLPRVQWKTVPATFLDFSAYQSNFNFYHSLLVVFVALLIIMLILTCRLIRHSLIDRRFVIFVVSAVIFGPVWIFIISITQSVYYDRYFIDSATFFYVYMGIIFAQSYHGSQKLLQIIGIIMVLILFAEGIIRVDRPQYDDISSLMHTINAESSSRSYKVLVAEHTLYYQVEYYSLSRSPTLITKAASTDGYGDMTPINSNPRLIANKYNLTGTVWVIYYGNKGRPVSIPASWHMLNEAQVYFNVQAREYRISSAS